MNERVSPERYCPTMKVWHQPLLKKQSTLISQKDVLLLHDITKLHAAKCTQEKILVLNTEGLFHPPSLPDFASLST